MATADFPDLMGGVEPCAEYAREFAEAWWGSVERPEDYWINLFSLPSSASRFYRYSGLLERIDADAGLMPLIYPAGAGDREQGASVARQDVYHANALFKERPARGRGRARDVGVAPGAWMDLDVKEGAFSRGSDIRALAEGELEKLGVKPSISVRTGGEEGGRHWYWVFERPLTPEEAREVGERLWLWVQQLAGVKLDNLSDAARVFRLPGTVKWSKNGAAVGAGVGTLVVPDWITQRRVSLERVRAVTGDAWTAWKEGQKQIRQERARADREALREWSAPAVRSLERLTGMALHYALYAAREVYPLRVSWESILLPAGWEKFGEPDDEGHQMWTRPHAPGEKVNPRSLVTDWDESPNVASLLSDSPATGLARLAAAGIPLTKVAVAAELHYGGSENALLRDFIVAEHTARDMP